MSTVIQSCPDVIWGYRRGLKGTGVKIIPRDRRRDGNVGEERLIQPKGDCLRSRSGVNISHGGKAANFSVCG